MVFWEVRTLMIQEVWSCDVCREVRLSCLSDASERSGKFRADQALWVQSLRNHQCSGQEHFVGAERRKGSKEELVSEDSFMNWE